MARGKDVFDKGVASFNTKLHPHTKATINALATVTGKGQREIIEEALEAYLAANPEAAAKTNKLLEVLQ